MTLSQSPNVGCYASAYCASGSVNRLVGGVIMGFDGEYVMVWDIATHHETICHVKGMETYPDSMISPTVLKTVEYVRQYKLAPRQQPAPHALPCTEIVEKWLDTYKGGPSIAILIGLSTLNEYLLEGVTVEDMISYLEALVKSARELIDDLERECSRSH